MNDINQDILNDGQYEARCIKEEITIEESDLNVVIKQEFECDQYRQDFETPCSSNNHKGHCNEMFGEDHKEHLIDHSDKRNIKCEPCENTVKNTAKLTSYIKNVHASDKPFQCEVCQKSFTADVLLKQHILSHNKETQFKCDRGDVIGEQFKVHMAEHSNQKNVKCGKCDKRYNSKKNLTKHMRYMHATVKLFKCDICTKSFTLAHYLERHMTSHSEERPFKCDRCPKTFKAQFTLVNHKAHVHGSGGRFSCDICGKLFIHLSYLKAHMTKHSDQKNVQCDKCHKSFKAKKGLIRHKRRVHVTEKSFQCKICDKCDKSFKTRKALAKHIMCEHATEKSLPCQICDKVHVTKQSDEMIVHCDKCDQSFKTKCILINHKKTMHDTETAFQCQICPKRFAFASYLKVHMASHNEERPFKCDHCPEAFKTKWTWINHNSRLHNSGGKFPCDICGKQFIILSHLKIHMIKHSDEKMFHCDKCDKKLKTKRILAYHMKKMHATEKSFKCEICSKSFAFVDNLKIHMASHSEERPFKCDQCPEAFKTKCILGNHKVRVHNTGGKFTCDTCGKLFITLSHLKAHTNKHSEEKSAYCDKCDKRFKTKDILTRHMKKMHATEKSFQCQICPKSFALQSDLKRHIATHNENTIFKCDECPETFKKKCTWVNHKARAHNDGAKFSCDVCKKLFTKHSQLKLHMTKHSNQKNVHCDKCDKRYKTKVSLATHMKTAHVAEKSFPCEIVDEVKIEPIVLYDSEMKRNVLDMNLEMKDEIEDKVTMNVDIKNEQDDIDY